VGEKNTAFFLGLEKTRQTKKAINELYDKNGKSTTDQNAIMEIEVDNTFVTIFFKLFQNFL
jgi:hypothetical protein